MLSWVVQIRPDPAVWNKGQICGGKKVKKLPHNVVFQNSGSQHGPLGTQWAQGNFKWVWSHQWTLSGPHISWSLTFYTVFNCLKITKILTALLIWAWYYFFDTWNGSQKKKVENLWSRAYKRSVCIVVNYSVLRTTGLEHMKAVQYIRWS